MCAEVTLKPWPLTRTVATSGERGPLLPLLLYTMPCRPVGGNIHLGKTMRGLAGGGKC